MATVLVFGAVEEDRLSPASLEAVTAAKVAAGESGTVAGALLGHGLEDASKAFAFAGLSHLYVVDDPRLSNYVGDIQIAAAEAAVRAAGADTLVIPFDINATEWVPRLAARLQAGLVPNCLRIEVAAPLTVTRALSGGALSATYAFTSQVRILMVAFGAYPEAVPGEACGITSVSLGEIPSRVELIETTPDVAGQGPQLKSAKVVVSGGLGLGSAAKWALVEQAAASLGGAVGASRAAVDIGWAPSSKQVGFSGLKISPDLYIALGISGALHHLAGIASAKRIVAVNKDSEAPIFQAAHLGIVGDVGDVIPAFLERVKELKAG